MSHHGRSPRRSGQLPQQAAGSPARAIPPPRPTDRQRPLWVPEGLDLQFVPAEVQQAVAELIEPMYRQFVIGAADGLERSIGVSLTHLLWLEILEQFDLKREYTQIDAVLNLAGNRHDRIDQHLRLVESKVRVGYFLMRIRELHEQAAARSSGALPCPLDPLAPGRIASSTADYRPLSGRGADNLEATIEPPGECSRG